MLICDGKLKIGRWLFAVGSLGLWVASPCLAVDVSGYANINLNVANWEDSKEAQFDIEKAAFIFTQQHDIYRFLGELQFEHAPAVEDGSNGAGTNRSDGQSGGELALERVYMQITPSKAFNLTLGKEQTSSIWLSNKYPNIYVNVSVPLMVTNIFHEYVRGASLFGKIAGNFTYRTWVTNSDGHSEQDPKTGHYVDNPGFSRLSFGGRLGWEGDFTNGSMNFGVLTAQYNDEDGNSKPVGAEIDVTVANATLWSEYAKNKTSEGYYAILSYAFNVGKSGTVSPFLMADELKIKSAEVVAADPAVAAEAAPTFAEDELATARRFGGGINYKPDAIASVKLEVLRSPKIDETPASTTVSGSYAYFFN